MGCKRVTWCRCQCRLEILGATIPAYATRLLVPKGFSRMNFFNAAACFRLVAFVTSLASPAEALGQTTSTCARFCPHARHRAFLRTARTVAPAGKLCGSSQPRHAQLRLRQVTMRLRKSFLLNKGSFLSVSLMHRAPPKSGHVRRHHRLHQGDRAVVPQIFEPHLPL